MALSYSDKVTSQLLAFVNAFFYRPGADPDVVAATTALRNLDPCGDVLSYMSAVQSNIEHASEVKVPILFAGGEKDALYPQPAAVQAQADLFSNAPTETATFPATGHALLQHKTEQQVQERLSQWLDDHGFGPPERTRAPQIPQVHVVDLAPLNGSGVHGKAILIQRGGQLRVIIIARGLEPGQPHAQHIHGLDGDTNAVCPSPDAADQIAGLPQEASDPDRFISLEEGQPSYGPVLLPLTPFPDAAPVGIVTYHETFPVSGDLSDLSDEVVVLHGLTLDGGYAASVPVACGQID
ncbi:hypothetical protein SAMN05661080_04082 [Modestobacter sp. DSM 44400]|uniref:alpha/beta hydrolase family protein n=1 Tax=Modestobacter sp. DSM 44400 TaxID=1550230 RepID=UPI00089A7B3E|nr:dienelactone hydrolase family protein [Modestobacter sp. DSM 44400]SDY62665.1 hypothetical protein SAMN05661080_04082 [Modestobacter sp. DSM 44400]